MSLRLRLTLVTVVVVALALITANVVVYELVARYLEDRYDERVESVVGPATSILISPDGFPDRFEGRENDRDGPRTDLTGANAELRDSDGEAVPYRVRAARRPPPRAARERILGTLNGAMCPSTCRES